jgi:hypothetical protein
LLDAEQKPERHGPQTNGPVGIEQDETVDEQTRWVVTERPVPGAIYDRCKGAGRLRMVKRDSDDTPSPGFSQDRNVVHQRRLKAPFRLRRRVVGQRRTPGRAVHAVTGEISAHLLAAT